MKLSNPGQFRLSGATLLCGLLMSAGVSAGELSIPNTFTANTPARASEVNSNFVAVKSAVDDNASIILTLQTALTAAENEAAANAALIVTLQTSLSAVLARLEAIESSPVTQLNSKILIDGNTVRFQGVNIQVTNGTGATGSINGLGNLIVGYDEARNDGSDNKTGSHNLIVGRFHNYMSTGGLVAGEKNTLVGAAASVTGGESNTGEGFAASVSGGSSNFASGSDSSVTGGFGNEAFGKFSIVSGGINNIADGERASVSGGEANVADGVSSHISGGSSNQANGAVSTVSGGLRNIATANFSTVGGGADRSTVTDTSWAAGSLLEAN